MRPKRSTVITFGVVVLLLLAGTVGYVLLKLDVFAPSLSAQLQKVEGASGSWWLGKSFAGMPVSFARPAGGDRVDDLGYGACQRFGGKLDPFATTRCGYPVLLQVRKRTYDLSLDELPTMLDGSSARTTVRGAPVVVGQQGAILYTGDLAIAVLGRPEDVGRALALVRPVNGDRELPRPSVGTDALSNCTRLAQPFRPLQSRLATLRRSPGRPLAWVGNWYAGGRLTTATSVGKTAVLGYASCGRESDLGACLETLSLSSDQADLSNVRDTLHGATCRTFHVGAAPGVAWTKDLAGETGAGVIVFTGDSTISLANDITLESIPMSRLVKVAKLVRPLPPATALPVPQYGVPKLLAGCASRAPA